MSSTGPGTANTRRAEFLLIWWLLAGCGIVVKVLLLLGAPLLKGGMAVMAMPVLALDLGLLQFMGKIGRSRCLAGAYGVSVFLTLGLVVRAAEYGWSSVLFLAIPFALLIVALAYTFFSWLILCTPLMVFGGTATSVQGARLLLALQVKGYDWVTLVDATELYSRLGGAAFRLPPWNDVGVLPGAEEGNVKRLVEIMLREREP